MKTYSKNLYYSCYSVNVSANIYFLREHIYILYISTLVIFIYQTVYYSF